MEQKKIERINELARKMRSEGLSEEEKAEQATLREEFRRGFVQNLTGQLENITIVEPNGNKIPVRDLKKKDEK